MSAATEGLPLVPFTSSYDYRKLGFAYSTMLGLTEQVMPHMGVWRPWAIAANYAQPFPLTEGSPGSHLGHEKNKEALKDDNSNHQCDKQ
ncbi:hypothetical protein DSO57_1014742 [Entomophthora muscae]|uniref:Uncharacterized protein n=1 Tax=Entomophthora muscae TaxID=34485 RepID=A0ACC2SUH1_9FUNG|nr:hypothetical protein DSO57_1014742 [Entomophthora muscae]